MKDFDVGAWQGVVAPAKTPGSIVDRLYTQVAEVLKLPATRERLGAAGTDIEGSTPKAFAQFIERDLEQNSRIVKAAGLKAD